MTLKVIADESFKIKIVGQTFLIETSKSIVPGKYKIELSGVYSDTPDRPNQIIYVNFVLTETSFFIPDWEKFAKASNSDSASADQDKTANNV